MEYGKWLIDKAAEVCGSRYALAKRLEVDEGNLSRYAKKGPPIEWIPALAEIAGEEPGTAVLRVLAERADAKKRPRGGAQGIGAAAMLLISYALSVGGSLEVPTARQSSSTVYASYRLRVSRWLRWVGRPLQATTRRLPA